MKELHQAPQVADTVFFDRGIPDIIAYLKASGLSIDEDYTVALKDYPYQKHVFILPPWQEIYVNDAERWQTFEESVVLYEAIKSVYLDLNFRLVEVPKLPLDARLRYIMREVDLLNQSNAELNF
jgi:predicted ATPase